MKLMVFLHGTTIMHKAGIGKTPEERTKQVEENEVSVHQYESYVPVGNSNLKLRSWVEQGAELFYLSSHKSEFDVEKDKISLVRHNFPNAPILFRHEGETYADVAERIMPDILIEDDCASIGGETEMTYPHINPEKKAKIKSIVVKEFSGIDNLPNVIGALKNLK